MQTNSIKALAAEMGVSEQEALGFIACLRVYTDKGYSLEQAIKANLATWTAFLDRVHQGQQSPYSPYRPAFEALQLFAIDTIHAAANSKEAA